MYLIHSVGTKEAAIGLSTLLERNGIQNTTRICVSLEKPDTIYSEIHGRAKMILSDPGHHGAIGLHYTGGTKVMAVQAYRAVEKATLDAGKQAVFSYLDANRLEMAIDPIGTASPQTFRVDLAVQPSLEDLLRLHKIQLAGDAPLREPHMLETANALATLHSAEDGVVAWANWCDEALRRPGDREKFKGAGELKQIGLPTDAPFSKIMGAFRAETGLSSKDLTLVDAISSSPWAMRNPRDAVEALAKWLDGGWLEHYALSQLQQIASEQRLHSSGMGIGLDTDVGESPYNFEVDVAAMRGYQIFAISCTRDASDRLCKSKLLEVHVRAAQLGGEEARAGLVSCHPNPAIVQKEVEDVWGVKDRVRVFGYRDLLHLSDRLAEWFETSFARRKG